ncbi:carbohydrate ABC transporter permease [Rhodococcus opacus]|uniref:Carbohydrate ABC transporter permease n=1 Tax=Rhodococcus jostii TaxID=132919 RepID=A0ABU4CNZ8_RHOJO|nr:MULTISPECIES: carbohydrate ABC transporter permease [Rhodococcus]ELB94101.1 sugar ABC transporter permease [Rhodococcus wratislaviensis IFP 2016]MDH6290689.1 multiple sugar transport system permease protein [Rhodococcus opacus]MDI9952987.1 carbohydrate ABC transporter permease [Rhodococcus sp. IEGM 1305]MDI9975146.1 carbohydrate ABC transporter permease [Rhodococcus sp. IEGM 1307]MDV6244171.1 carbohydrate ABC transporter permease [Rhodococcus opacus]
MSTAVVTPGIPRAAVARRRRAPSLASIRTYLGLAVIVVWGLAPVYWMVVTAFRHSDYTFDTTPWPTHVTLENFASVFSTEAGNHFARALVNSTIIGAVTTAIGLVVGVGTAYALARLQFRGKHVVLGIILAASMFPGVAVLTPLFQLFTSMGWFGTYQALIIPNISFVLPLTIYTLTAFFKELPWELEEAARIDGASRRQAFRMVLLPLAAPGLFTTAILAFIASWNEYLISSQLSNDVTQPATVAIAQFAGSKPHEEPFTSVMAAGTVVTIPLVIIVLLLQRRIVSGLTAGGVK